MREPRFQFRNSHYAHVYRREDGLWSVEATFWDLFNCDLWEVWDNTPVYLPCGDCGRTLCVPGGSWAHPRTKLRPLCPTCWYESGVGLRACLTHYYEVDDIRSVNSSYVELLFYVSSPT